MQYWQRRSSCCICEEKRSSIDMGAVPNSGVPHTKWEPSINVQEATDVCSNRYVIIYTHGEIIYMVYFILLLAPGIINCVAFEIWDRAQRTNLSANAWFKVQQILVYSTA